MKVTTGLKVVVHFPAAAEPFMDQQADPTETVGELKQRVLNAFGLTEGPTGDGNLATYTLYSRKEPLVDLTQAIGDITPDQKILQLKLQQQIVQG